MARKGPSFPSPPMQTLESWASGISYYVYDEFSKSLNQFMFYSLWLIATFSKDTHRTTGRRMAMRGIYSIEQHIKLIWKSNFFSSKRDMPIQNGCRTLYRSKWQIYFIHLFLGWSDFETGLKWLDLNVTIPQVQRDITAAVSIN